MHAVAAGLAGAQAEPYGVWLEDWQVRQTGENQYQLTASQADLRLELTPDRRKRPGLSGARRAIRKGAKPRQRLLLLQPDRLASSGTVTIGEDTFAVNGWSWKDHEFSTSVLSEGQIGWDWFSIQLDNDTELMLYHIRQADGSIDPYSSGTLVYADGSTRHLSPDDFTISVQNTWTSPNTGGEYPSKWQISIPSEQIELTLTPYIDNQELLVTVIYWEEPYR